MTTLIDIEIDGKPLKVVQNSTVIEAADEAGIYIPRFCYHKKLSIAANCRMCLVEIEKSGKPLPACATPVTPGMKVLTKSVKTKAAQKAVMEFLLINHPLDCPICDQGGECELQDISLGYGRDSSQFIERKRAVKDDNFGPLIATEMTRCIQCTRCVRFGQEIAGIKEIGAVDRGEHMQISTYIQHSLVSEISGNIIDLCPVGALTSKPFRFTARPWELAQTPSIAPHDCLGSHIYIHRRRQQIMRIVPREEEAINENWLSDRDRYSYTAIKSQERLTQPLIKVKGQWQVVSWEIALEKIVKEIKAIIEKEGPGCMSICASPNTTTEEFYVIQKLFRALGSNNIDHRLHQTDFSDQEFFPLMPKMPIALEDLNKAPFILLIGSSITREQPLAAHRIRKASRQGAKIASIHCVDYDFYFNIDYKHIVSPDDFISILEQLAVAIDPKFPLLSNAISAVEGFIDHTMVEHLKKEKAVIILGAVAHNHPQAAFIRSLVSFISEKTGAKLIYFHEGANTMGAWLAGAVPHRAPLGKKIASPGLTIQQAWQKKLKAYFLLNVEPELDCANPAMAKTALTEAELVVALTPFDFSSIAEYATVLLPISTFGENTGTFINVEGKWQSFTAAAPPPGEALPAWKVITALGRLFNLPGLDYEHVGVIKTELESFINETEIEMLMNSFPLPLSLPKNEKQGIVRITEWPLYSSDNLVRHSLVLQQSAGHELTGIYINPILGDSLKLKEGQIVNVEQDKRKARLVVFFDKRIPDGCAWIPGGREETQHLGESFGVIEVHV